MSKSKSRKILAGIFWIACSMFWFTGSAMATLPDLKFQGQSSCTPTSCTTLNPCTITLCATWHGDAYAGNVHYVCNWERCSSGNGSCCSPDEAEIDHTCTRDICCVTDVTPEPSITWDALVCVHNDPSNVWIRVRNCG
jgi:hypothetical protein